MKSIQLDDVVALTADIPEAELFRGQTGAVVMVYGAGEAFEVEFVDEEGQTYGLETIRPEQPALVWKAPPEK